MKRTLIVLISILYFSCNQDDKKSSEHKGPPGRESFAEVEAKALK